MDRRQNSLCWPSMCVFIEGKSVFFANTPDAIYTHRRGDRLSSIRPSFVGRASGSGSLDYLLYIFSSFLQYEVERVLAELKKKIKS